MKQKELTIDTNVSSIVYLMKNYAGYNLWANVTLVNWLRTKPADILEQEVPSSFNSIKATIAHILDVQQYWLSVIKKAEPKVAERFNGTIEEAIAGLVESSDELADYVESMTDEALEANNLVISPWFQCDFQNFEYIMQVMNHGTYHRGQIITIGRNLGFPDAPMTDYNFYNIHGK
ncbi:DinB family protein [Mucilaginibacter xinganensis]|uniref:DinB family protein n=1 Tax=Mucilaginibacter xinganensis TaxID=1234841 RepID=A0A223NQK3_9SPHI|nr:DinB family protein [Mucilaginibacter xinganensis]ASU32189.1 DinB family protein [Mucilaginibacter xinganensis]